MTHKAAYLAEMREDFVQRWQPKDDGSGWRHEFRTELDRLIYAAFGVAQEPYVKELEVFRDHAIATSTLIAKTG